MQTLERLDADDLVAWVTTYRDVLADHRERINLLNVYPVPDGDTGTNMALTLGSVVTELEALATEGPRDLAAVSHAISHGSLMGARGNSGVILSQILRGLVGAFADAAGGFVDAAVLVAALDRAREGAYAAVGNPVEGTILTVMRGASDAAGALGENAGLVEVLDVARQGAERALEATPSLLPVLEAAGVVDSGGAGLVLLFDAGLHVADGRDLPDVPDDGAPVGGGGDALCREAGRGGSAAPGEGGVGDLRYEVMYLLEAPDDAIGAFREVWAGVGDSIVVVGGDGLYNCHIHTDDIGAAVEAALDAGRPRHIRVSDLWDQVEEERWVREADPGSLGPSAPPSVCAVVAVCNGDGIRRIFRSLGVAGIVSGGQSMNPSTADLVAAVDAVASDEVVILPNNTNVVAVAEAAARASTKAVRVVATAGIPEGFAALLGYDPEGDADANAEAMAASARRVAAGEVTRAVRDSEGPDGPISTGDWLGIGRRGIVVAATTVADAATALLDHLIDDAHREIVTVITGEGAQAAATRRITEWLAAHHPAITAEVHPGGQPLYPYLFSIE